MAAWRVAAKVAFNGMNNNCNKCGANEAVYGLLEVRWRIGFKPNSVRLKFWSLRSRVPISATMCRNCGYIELFGDCGILAGMIAE